MDHDLRMNRQRLVKLAVDNKTVDRRYLGRAGPGRDGWNKEYKNGTGYSLTTTDYTRRIQDLL